MELYDQVGKNGLEMIREYGVSNSNLSRDLAGRSSSGSSRRSSGPPVRAWFSCGPSCAGCDCWNWIMIHYATVGTRLRGEAKNA